MKILYIISSLSIGGAQRLLSDILPLINSQNEVALMVNDDVKNVFSVKVKAAGVHMIINRCNKLHNPKNIFEIAKVAKGYDVVHVHLFPMVYWAAFASLIFPTKLVYTEHSTSNRRRGKWYFRLIEQFVYSRYEKIISISQQTQNSLMKWVRANEGDTRFLVINNGVNISSFRNIKYEKIYPHTLLMVSRFVASKDQMTVIRAMNLLPEDVHVIFVGDGETIESNKSFTKEVGLTDRVHFVGKQSDVASWIAKADIGVQSSNWEGFGLTAVEMMAAGKPVVATDVDGLRQVVEGAGLLFPVGDDRALANTILALLNSKDYYDVISMKCKERAKLYDVKKTADAYCEIYRTICG